MSIREIGSGEFEQRQTRAIDAARDRGLTALLVWSKGGTSVDFYGDVLYLANFHSPFPPNSDTERWAGRSCSALILPTDADPVLIVDIPDYDRDLVCVDDVRFTTNVPETVASVLREKQLDRERIGLVARDTLLWTHLRAIEAALGRPLELEPVDELLETLRRFKSPSELALVRAAAECGVAWMSKMMEAVVAGRTEGDVVGEGLRTFAALGGFPYDVAVASGPRSYQFFGVPRLPAWDSTRLLKRGDLFHVDAWGPVNYYYTDFVRSTVVGGKPTAAQREVLDGSIALVEHIIDGVKPGITAGGLYDRGAAWLLDNGYGAHDAAPGDTSTDFGSLFPAFGHCIGLGLEAPWLYEGEPTRLEPNMVVAVEALVARPEVGGAGFEQDVVVTDTGCEVLTASCPSTWWG